MSKYDFTGVLQWNRIKGWVDLSEAIAMQTIVKQLPRGSRLVELGTFQGRSSVAIASVLPPESILYCVDLFRVTILQPGEEKPTLEVVVKNNLEALAKNLEAFGVKDKIRVQVMSTAEAARQFDSESLDLVFVDAAHDYDNVKADILNWYPKLKPGGFLVCDDYDNPSYPEVAMAVKTVGLFGEVVAPSLWVHRKPSPPLVHTQDPPEIF